jgi:hypothetical protein
VGWFVIVSWPVALAVVLTLWTARLTVATLHLTWRVIRFLCRLLGKLVVWATYGEIERRINGGLPGMDRGAMRSRSRLQMQYFSDGRNKLIRVDFDGAVDDLDSMHAFSSANAG